MKDSSISNYWLTGFDLFSAALLSAWISDLNRAKNPHPCSHVLEPLTWDGLSVWLGKKDVFVGFFFWMIWSCSSSLGPNSREFHPMHDSKALCLREEARVMTQHVGFQEEEDLTQAREWTIRGGIGYHCLQISCCISLCSLQELCLTCTDSMKQNCLEKGAKTRKAQHITVLLQLKVGEPGFALVWQLNFRSFVVYFW